MQVSCAWTVAVGPSAGMLRRALIRVSRGHRRSMMSG
jgi:hypothetical protein